MSAPALFANRFEIQQALGSGGMGTVYRARDQYTGRTVALKIPHAGAEDASSWERFDREAKILSALEHPGIVAYVAHGQAQNGQRYIAMEWLEGEVLSERLAARGLTVAECLTLLRGTAAALQVAHALGIVHRDIKPSNLFLRDGRVDRTMLLDFGIARLTAAADVLTQADVIIGTPGYMAPEQARGDRDVGPSADLFSLGCVLFLGLTGRPPFVAGSGIAVLAKILCEEAPRLRSFRPDLPVALESLLARMLAKEVKQRPSDAAALLREIEQLELFGGESGAQPPTVVALPQATVLQAERRLICVLLMSPQTPEPEDLPTAAIEVADSAEAHRRSQQALEIVESFGARGSWMMNGALVATLSGLADATDLVAQAARCALALARIWPDAQIAVATGRGQVDARAPIGEVIECAAHLLRGDRATPPAPTPTGEREPAGETTSEIRVDELSARLLERQFALNASALGFVLTGELQIDAARPLLGKPTPCVGREAELASLEAQLATCLEESEAHAVLITAPPGTGKSRLRHEFLRRLRARGEPVTLLEGRAEPTGAGTPYFALARALRSHCEISEGEPLEVRQRKLVDRLSRTLGADSERVAAFLGELCAIPFSADSDPALRAARQSPEAMNQEIRRSFVKWLRAECEAAPVLLLLDDLHWADALTIGLLDQVLGELGDARLMIIALARPEVRQVFNDLWSRRRLQEMVLKEMSRKACERLARQVLGTQVPAQVIARLCEQSGGNALFLEELLRVVAEGKELDQADTVIAMLQARFSRLSTETRRVLRAASVFGQTFWRGGVAAIFGEEAVTSEIEQGLRELRAAEIIEKHEGSRLAAEVEYGFRHALVREAAYSLLLPADLQTGHKRAGKYLISAGESDPQPIAEHLERGGLLQDAVAHYINAAERCLWGGDYRGALTFSDGAVRCGASGEALGHVRALQGEAYGYTVDREQQARICEEAVTLLPEGSRLWYRPTWCLVSYASVTGNQPLLEKWAGKLIAATPAQDAAETFDVALGSAVAMVSVACQFDLARALHQRIVEVQRDRSLSTWSPIMMFAQASYLRHLEPDPYLQLKFQQDVLDLVHAVGRFETIALFEDFLGEAQAELGDWSSGEVRIRANLERVRGANQTYLVLHAQLHLAEVLLMSPDSRRHAEAAQLACEVLTVPKLSASYQEWSRGLLAQALLRSGDSINAEAEACRAIELHMTSPLRRLWIIATRIEALLAQQRTDEACVHARASLQEVERLGTAGYVEIPLRLAAANALMAAGDRAAAEHELFRAGQELDRRAAKIPDPAVRTRFLTQVSENAEVLSRLGRSINAPS